jgi:hypothetical protein
MTTNVIEKNDLPDSAFAYIEPGGAKDAVGKTAPRALRHLPYKTAGGDVDLELLVKALNAVPETNLPRATQARVAAKLESVAKRHQKSDRVEKYITREDGKWQVRAESGRVLGTHDSKADAAAQLAAIEAGKHRKAKAGGAVEWPVMPRPGFRGSKPERLAGEKAPNQKSEDGSIDDALVEKAWTDEARAAALEARRRGAAASGRERDERHWYGGDRDPSYRRRMDFVRTVEDKYGGAVADQASAILGVATHRDRFQGTHGFKAKEPLGEQNSNALRLISGHAHKLGLNKLGDKIDRYLGTTKAAKEGDCLFSPVEKVWSDEARAAAAEARRGRSGGRSPMRTGSQMESDAQRAGNRADDRDWARTQRENPRARPGYRPSDRAPKTPHTHAVMVDGGFDKTFPDAESAKAYAERLRSRSRSGIPSNRPTRATVTRIPRDLREKSAGPRVAGE